jgi:potassium efflux system protein
MNVPVPCLGRALRPAILCLLWWGVLLGARAADSGKAAGTPIPAAASPSPSAEPAVPLTDIAEQSQATSTRLNTFIAEGPADQGVAATRQALPDLSAQVDHWLDESTKTLAQRPSLADLGDLQSGGRKLEDDLKAQGAALNERAKTLQDEAAQVRADQERWTSTAKEAHDAGAPADTLALCDAVVATAQRAAAGIKARSTGVLELQTQLSALSGKVSAEVETVRQANAAALKTLFVRDSDPLWAMQSATPEPGGGGKALAAPSQPGADALAYARQHVEQLFEHVAIILVLLGILFWLKRGLQKWTEDDPSLQRAAPIFEVPIATAITLSFLLKGPIYSDAPAAFKAIMGTLLLLPVIVLLRRLLDARLHAVLYFLILFYFVGQVRLFLTGYPLLERWIFTGEMAAAILAFWWVTTTSGSRTEEDVGSVLGKWPRRLCRLAILLLFGALVAEVLGYVQLGTTAGSAVLRSSYVAVFFYALVRVLGGLVLIGLRARPLSISHIARQHRSTVHTRVFRALRVLAVFGWLWLTLGFFAGLQNLVVYWGTKVLDSKLPAGTMSPSVGQLLGFAAAIWVSVNVARLIRFVLEEEIFQRVHLSAGLPYAISTILNYLVLFVGLLVALGLLGVDLTRITILAGAFSVGLGFGLQNIINNFVSGIILLFERPVKVGDIIQIGDAIGEVRRIGIRASVIGTRDGSDIIVPNGNLISNQFTNWTYSDRHRSVEIPLNIATGPDPNHVLELLKTAAAAHASTREQAAPEAYITSLTATAMSLVVRAWISHYEDWVETRSDLTVALVEALAREDIKLV